MGGDSLSESRSSSPDVFRDTSPSPGSEHKSQSLPHSLIRNPWSLTGSADRDSSHHSLDQLSNEGEREDVALVTSKCEMHFEDNSSEEDHYSSNGEIDEDSEYIRTYVLLEALVCDSGNDIRMYAYMHA